MGCGLGAKFFAPPMRGLSALAWVPLCRQCGVLSPAFLCKIKVTGNNTAAA
jgi:hypothetical protein